MAASTWSEVFISHRGLEMKLGFANCLHHALEVRGIASFLDMESLTKGHDVREDFPVAVRRAIVQVPILTDDFGTSIWCLEELANMMDSKSTVFPVFFNLQSDDLREEEGTFGKGLKDCIRDRKPGEETIKRWKNALEKVSWLEGFRLETYGGAQGALIRDLVTTISNEIDRRRSVDTTIGLVGLDNKVREVVQLLCLQDTASVHVVLIWGMGGVGKTTLARAIHSYMLSLKEFEVACFIPNCGHLQLIEIQKEVLARLLRREVKQMDIGIGKSCLKEGLKNIKVLIILDDMNFLRVEEIVDLKELCPGSRLLLTSRDEGGFSHESYAPVLRCKIYSLATMVDRESLQLFCVNAFNRTFPKVGFENLAMEIVNACGGLPLALEVCGRYVRNLENELQWREAIQKLKLCKHKDILEKLKVTVSSLEDEQQQMFREVACFFVGEKVSTVKRFWRATGKSCELGLLKLQQLCLVKVDENKCLTMHDLLKGLGREMGRESKTEICNDEDLRQLLRERKDLDKIRGICTSLSCLQVKDVANMTNLQLLFLHATESVYEDEMELEFEYLSDLKWLKWCRSCESFLQLKTLEEMDLIQCSKFVKLFESFGSLKCLEVLHASELGSLVHLPPSFGQLKKLWELRIDYCRKMVGLPESFGSLECLEVLHASGLWSLVHLPSSFGQLKKLRELCIDDCFELVLLPESFGSLECLEVLHASGLCSLVHLPPSFGQLKKLRELRINGCFKLVVLPESFGSLQCLEVLHASGLCSLVHLPPSFGQLKKLRELYIDGCEKMVGLPESFGSLECLEVLHASGLCSLVHLPPSFGQLKKLRELRIDSCEKMVRLPESLGSLECLEVLHASRLHLLVHLPPSFGQLKKLRELHIDHCEKLVWLPESFGSLECLEVLNARGYASELRGWYVSGLSSLVHLPPSFDQLKKLRELHIDCCEKMVGLPKSFGSLQCLEVLNASGLSLLLHLPPSFGQLKKLRELRIDYCEKMVVLPESFGSLECLEVLHASGLCSLVHLPPSFGQLKKLRELRIDHCEKLVRLPESFGSLECLEVLHARRLHSLVHLPPSFGQLKKLRELRIDHCKKLVGLPESFGSLECLEVLHASRLVSLVHVPQSFGQLLKKLRELHIDRGSKLNLEQLGIMHLLRGGAAEKLSLLNAWR